MARLSSARTQRVGGPWVRAAAPVGALVALGLVLAAVVPFSDVGLYRSYGAGLPHGHLPTEYPALAGVVFFLPRALPVPYQVGFALMMVAALLGLLAVGWRGSEDGGGAAQTAWARRFGWYVSLGTAAVMFSRFDLLPALAVLLAVQRARTGRWWSAWGWAVAGALIKVFPLLLLPGFLLAERRASGRTPWRRAAAAAAALAGAAALQALLAPGTLLRPLGYEVHRGFEFSSVPGTLSLLADPAHLHYGFAFGNHQVAGAGHATIGALTTLAAVAGLLAVWRLAGAGRLPVEATSLAVVTVAVVTDKALAPQYLLWLAPLWAYWRLRPSWVVAAALTTLVFPVLFVAAPGGSLYAGTVVSAIRNAALIGGSVAWLIEGLRTRWQTVDPAGNDMNGKEMEVPLCSAIA